MSKPLDKKLLDYILEMAYRSLPFGSNKWDSSAQDFKNDLAKRGIKLSRELFYKYKLPGGMSPQEFQDRIALEYFCRNFYLSFSKYIKQDKNLTWLEKMKIRGFVWKMRRDKTFGNMKLWEKEIREKNPELSEIVLHGVKSSAFVYGALFGFAPEEIKYFVSGFCNFKRADKINTLLLNKYDIDLKFVLAPDVLKEVLLALKNQKE